MTYHASPSSAHLAPVASVRRIFWSQHALGRLRERTTVPLAQVQRDALAALVGGRAEEWWEFDPRRGRGERRNLLVRMSHPSGDLSRDCWLLFRLDEREPSLAHAVTTLTPHQYQANASLLWSRTRGGPKGDTTLKQRPFAPRPPRK